MSAKTVLITGANSGIGKSAATTLAKQGMHLFLMCRTQEKSEQTKQELQKLYPNSKIDTLHADLSSFAEVRSAAGQYIKKGIRLDILINNAGFLPRSQNITQDGFEESFQANHLSHFLLTHLLFPTLSKEARIIHVSSRAHMMVTPKDWIKYSENNYQYEPFAGFKVYALTKLCNILFSNKLHTEMRLRNINNISTNALHPGVVASNFGQSGAKSIGIIYKLFAMFMKNNDQGAATTIHLASDEEIGKVSGKYFADSKIKKTSPTAANPKNADQLWEDSLKMCGIDDFFAY